MELADTVDIISKLWDYIYEKKKQDGKATNRLMAHLGLDNPHQVRTKSFDEWKGTVDKFFIAQEIFKKR